MANGDKEVSISLDKNGSPVPDQDPIRIKKDNQRIRWSAPFDFTIDVEDYDDLQYGNGGGTFRCTSGKFSEVKRYKYSITANGVTNDPEIDIDP